MEKAQEVLGKATGGKVGHKLPVRKLGKQGPEVTALGFGAMGLSSFYGEPKPDAERLKVLDKCYELGDMFIDTADMYKDNEDLIGKWLAANPHKREHIFLATKFAGRSHSDGSPFFDSSPEWCREAIQSSLSRLGLPYVDLYYCHRLDGKTPIESTMAEMKELKREGKIKHIGLSECSAESLRRACKVEHVDAVQIEYSPFTLDIESPEIGLLKACRELGVAIVAYSPIGRGMLGGQISSPDDFEEGDFRRFAPRFSPENFPKNLELVDKITEMAKKKNATPSQLTLAWIMAQGPDFFPIPGTTNVDRLEENVGALKLKISKEEEKEIRQACEAATVAGTRYPESFMQACFADTPPVES